MPNVAKTVGNNDPDTKSASPGLAPQLARLLLVSAFSKHPEIT